MDKRARAAQRRKNVETVGQSALESMIKVSTSSLDAVRVRGCDTQGVYGNAFSRHERGPF